MLIIYADIILIRGDDIDVNIKLIEIIFLLASFISAFIFIRTIIKKKKFNAVWFLLTVIITAAFVFSFFDLLQIDDKKDILNHEDIIDISVYMGNADDEFSSARENMLRDHIISRGITDPAVLKAMGSVKRHLFVDKLQTDMAYNDHPLPIGEGQTISQPYIVALMTEVLEIKPGDKVLEIGTGSGYQAAVLAEITDNVYSIEIKQTLVESALENLHNAGYDTVQVKYGDGYFGWEEHALFDAIIITCASNHVPPQLIHQLKNDGKLVLPLGNITYYQTLTLIEKEGEELKVSHITTVSFVPMTGEAIR